MGSIPRLSETLSLGIFYTASPGTSTAREEAGTEGTGPEAEGRWDHDKLRAWDHRGVSTDP